MHTAFVPEFTTDAKIVSLFTDIPALFVMPKAVRIEFLIFGGFWKKSVSVGLAPGHPPSI